MARGRERERERERENQKMRVKLKEGREGMHRIPLSLKSAGLFFTLESFSSADDICTKPALSACLLAMAHKK